VHFGKFVAESKYLENPKKYEELVAESNVQGIISQLTNIEVERRVLRRAFVKASTYGQDVTGGTKPTLIIINEGVQYV
jgi:chorismate mutase